MNQKDLDEDVFVESAVPIISEAMLADSYINDALSCLSRYDEEDFLDVEECLGEAKKALQSIIDKLTINNGKEDIL